MVALCKACAQPFSKYRWGQPVLDKANFDLPKLKPVVRKEPEVHEACPLATILGLQHNAKFLRQSRIRNSEGDVFLEYGLDQPNPVTLMLRIPHGGCRTVVIL